jgi:hypothetical protein
MMNTVLRISSELIKIESDDDFFNESVKYLYGTGVVFQLKQKEIQLINLNKTVFSIVN